MTITTFLQKEETDIGTQPVGGQVDTDFGQLTSLSFKASKLNFNSDSRDRLITEEQLKRLQIAEDILGRQIKPEDSSSFKPFRPASSTDFGGPLGVDARTITDEIDRTRHNDRFTQLAIDEFKANDVDRFRGVPTRSQVLENARERAQMSTREFENAARRTSGFKSFSARLLGGFGAAAVDPINIATLPFGAGAARGFLKTVLISAGTATATEAAVQPFVVQWQRELGNEYGFGEVAENLGFAALFGGSFAAAVKGIKASASALFTRLSKNKDIPQGARSSASTMSRSAHARENNPLPRAEKISDIKRHNDSMRSASEAFGKSERIDQATLKISESEFNNVDTAPRRGDTEIKKTQLDEIRRFQAGAKQNGNVSAQNAPRFTIDTLPQQILDKANAKRGALTRNDFEPEELAMLKSAGIEPAKNGRITKKPLITQREQRGAMGQLQDMKGKQREHIEAYRGQVRDIETEGQNLDLQEDGIARAIAETQRFTDRDVSASDVTQELLKRADAPDTIRAENEAFSTFVKENPD